jgi:hypothetical protein
MVEYYPKKHTARVYLPDHNQHMEIRLPVHGSNGSGTGILFRPIKGLEGHGAFKGGRSAMFGGKYEALHWNHSTENMPPDHPDLEGQEGCFVHQAGLQYEDDTVEPSTIRVVRNDGGVTEVMMGEHKLQKEHATDERMVGPSITTSEAMAVSSANKLFKAMEVADRMMAVADGGDLTDPEDLSEISRGFDTMGSRFESAHIDGANSASSFGETVISQGEAAGIGANAAGLASGVGDYDSLG